MHLNIIILIVSRLIIVSISGNCLIYFLLVIHAFFWLWYRVISAKGNWRITKDWPVGLGRILSSLLSLGLLRIGLVSNSFRVVSQEIP